MKFNRYGDASKQHDIVCILVMFSNWSSNSVHFIFCSCIYKFAVILVPVPSLNQSNNKFKNIKTKYKFLKTRGPIENTPKYRDQKDNYTKNKIKEIRKKFDFESV